MIRMLFVAMLTSVLVPQTVTAQAALPPDGERGVVLTTLVDYLLAGDTDAAVAFLAARGDLTASLERQVRRVAEIYGHKGYVLTRLRPEDDSQAKVEVELRHTETGARRILLVIMAPGTVKVTSIMFPATLSAAIP